MKPLNDIHELRLRLLELELKKQALEKEMKEELDRAADNFKPMKLIRSAIAPSKGEDEENKQSLVSSLIGTGAAFLLKKVLYKTPAGAAAGVVSTGLGALLAARPDLPGKALEWLKNLGRRKKRSEQDDANQDENA